MTRTAYTTTDLWKVLGINIDKCKDWLKKGYIKPNLGAADGRGTKNLFSLYDLYAIGLFQELVAKGFPRKQASSQTQKIARRLGSSGMQDRWLRAEYVAFYLKGKTDIDASSSGEVGMMTIDVDENINGEDYNGKVNFNELNILEDNENATVLLINFRGLREKIDNKLR
ncbi:MerR family transcriptional regulator [Desulfosudis oleivorans]|uniref:hypothetical protein n=1 Tax=Desulfosudis oleivorans TaxID=181663 RepID=UPI00059D2A87|nr:hypothetical protein [Desulfosudis oleivorans]